MIEIALLLAWVFTHALYRGAVGTVCTFKKVDPPWVRSRQERLTNREVRRADRKAVLDSKRTARGFLARLWGDLWQDANTWLDEAHEEKRKRRKEHPEGKPVVSVDADQAADWARNLEDKVKSIWNRWWGPSQRKCPWLIPVLNDAHTHVEGRACGQRVRLRHTYCTTHQAFADLGHCLWANGDSEIPPCMSHRHGHFPFCAPHLEEWGNNTADQEAAATPATPEAAQIGELTTPAAPDLAGAPAPEMRLGCQHRVDDGAGFFQACGRPVPAGATDHDCGQHHGDYGCKWMLGDPGRPCNQTVPLGNRFCPKHQALVDPVKRQPDEPLCQWGRSTTSESPDHGQTPCPERAGAGGIHCLPHQIEYGRWEAGNTPQPLPSTEPVIVTVAAPLADTQQRNVPPEESPNCPIVISASGQTCGMPMRRRLGNWVCMWPHDPVQGPATPPESETATTTEPVADVAEPEVPPQRPTLRVVPNTNTQGDTDTMTTSATSEITSVQALASFAAKVKAHGDTEWPQMLEAAESQMGQAGLTNDPALTSAIGGMREAAAMFAARGAELEAALVPHQAAAEQVSGLGNRAADKTATYQNQ